MPNVIWKYQKRGQSWGISLPPSSMGGAGSVKLDLNGIASEVQYRGG